MKCNWNMNLQTSKMALETKWKKSGNKDRNVEISFSLVQTDFTMDKT